MSLDPDSQNRTAWQNISAHQLHDLELSACLLDVRTRIEYRWKHIPAAVQLSRPHILSQIPREQPVVVICLSGHRSIPVAHWLLRQGYQTVYNLEGGFFQWWRAGYPTVSGPRPTA